MKSLKVLVMMMALTVLPWAQTSTPNSPSPAQSTTKSECPCCQKMAEGKEGKSCCAHHDMAVKDGKAMSCCQAKGGKSCMKGGKKEMAACAKEGCCGSDAKDCCKKDGDKSAMACCSGGQCGMHHDAEPDAMR
jgi:hypothetical protein